MSLKEKIKDMRKFLWSCHVTGYLLPEQIAVLEMGLDALENVTLFADVDQMQSLEEILEAKIEDLSEVRI